MKRHIENGITILNTGDMEGGLKNKTGFRGVSQYGKRYRADITFQNVKYSLGMFSDIQIAINARLIAEAKKKEGVLLQWLETKPHGHSSNCMDFWNACFKEYGLTVK